MTTAREGHRPLLVWQLQLQVGEDVDDIIVILCLYFRSPSAAEMYLLLSCFLLGGTAAGKKARARERRRSFDSTHIAIKI